MNPLTPPQKRLRRLRMLTRTPARLPVLAFLLLIAAGALLLLLPAATTNGISGMDALFTATSATCVTGLAVRDTAATFTLFGRSVLLFLIQVGGIGIMTLSTLLLLAAGKRPGISDRIVLQDAFTHSSEKSPAGIIRDVILLTLGLETLGALLLFFRFLFDMPMREALGMAVFHSISAFCNAGFALFPDSLVAYRRDLLVNGVIGFLILTGGSGFLAIAEIGARLDHDSKVRRLSLHTKLVLATTLVLLVGGWGTFLAMEWHNTLKALPVSEKLLAAFFQSVTFRTAGFNTLDMGSLANETLLVALFLMFIGASPGSCGGGIKTTTAATLFLLGKARLQGWQKPFAFGRSIPDSDVNRATSLMLLSSTIVGIGTLFLLISEVGGVSHGDSRGLFIEILFEAVSAFGTVGLSTGITPMLSSFGKIIITVLMFTGRLGPLVIAIAVSRKQESRFCYAEEKVMIG